MAALRQALVVVSCFVALAFLQYPWIGEALRIQRPKSTNDSSKGSEPLHTLSPKVVTLLERAKRIARGLQHNELHPLHLTAALLENPQEISSKAIELSGGHMDTLIGLLLRQLKDMPLPLEDHEDTLRVSSGLAHLFLAASAFARQRGDTELSEIHVLSQLYRFRQIHSLFEAAGVDQQAFIQLIEQLLQKGAEGPLRGEEASVLEKYTRDLTKDAADNRLDPIIGRDQEIRKMMEALSRKNKNNPVLIGEPGVGKTAVVEGLAQRIYENDVPVSLRGCKILALDLGALVAGTTYRGDFEERLRSVLDILIASKGKLILFVDEVHLLLGAGKGEGAMDAANLLKPKLTKGDIRIIGATTGSEYRRYMQKDEAFERRFQPIVVREPSIDTSVSILRGVKPRYEAHHNITIADDALVAAVLLTYRYMPDRRLPDKALDAVDEACANLRIQLDSRPDAIDEIDRHVSQLELEIAFLEKEEGVESKKRLESIKDTVQMEKRRLEALLKQYDEELAVRDQQKVLKQQIEETEQMLRNQELGKRKQKELQYTVLPKLHTQLNRISDLNSSSSKSREPPVMLSNVLTADRITRVVARATGIPIEKLTENEKQTYLHLSDILGERVIGQKDALVTIQNALLRSRAGLSRRDQPLGSFLFLGPSGVGKTEVAKALADCLFTNEKDMVRFDMSEFLESHSVSKLIGSPPGYVGHESGGKLTEAVRNNPYSVILLDEIEKAHPLVLNVLLQLFDDGRLTDGRGKTIDFSNTVVIMTSNLGSRYYEMGFSPPPHAEAAGPSPPSEAMVQQNLSTENSATPIRSLKGSSEDKRQWIRQNVLVDVRAFFRPELLNRIDAVVVFDLLTKDQLKQIMQLQLKDISKHLKDKDIEVQFTDEAIDTVVDIAYSPEYGARPLKRYIQKTLVTKLSVMLLSGTLTSNSSVTIEKSADNADKLVIMARKKNAKDGTVEEAVYDITELGGEEDLRRDIAQIESQL